MTLVIDVTVTKSPTMTFVNPVFAQNSLVLGDSVRKPKIGFLCRLRQDRGNRHFPVLSGVLHGQTWLLSPAVCLRSVHSQFFGNHGNRGSLYIPLR